MENFERKLRDPTISLPILPPESGPGMEGLAGRFLLRAGESARWLLAACAAVVGGLDKLVEIWNREFQGIPECQDSRFYSDGRFRFCFQEFARSLPGRPEFVSRTASPFLAVVDAHWVDYDDYVFFGARASERRCSAPTSDTVLVNACILRPLHYSLRDLISALSRGVDLSTVAPKEATVLLFSELGMVKSEEPGPLTMAVVSAFLAPRSLNDGLAELIGNSPDLVPAGLPPGEGFTYAVRHLTRRGILSISPPTGSDANNPVPPEA